MLEEANWTVGRVAKRCGVKVSTLHYYERQGLIRSWRNDGNQRRYKADVLRRISVIKAAQKMGISLADIKAAFASLPNNRTPTKEDWNELAASWQAQLNARIHYLETLRDSLSGCIGCGCLSLNSCPIYNPEDALASEGEGAVILERDAVQKK
ncbi:redox-sensitive transcriptional activator SoxR [Thalassotalea euphylliae]|uniref:Redox-sensitive transcriptional activator SoxR n=1 Tax=Thalassotalea euphylliae TaxID=1655234 RepID=A0A3E0UAN6_9GAMM|nr:redox-sensitive transcriptional activator SoxR [Thalassotalea euphylliae]REL34081.1 redox-sensitive transcriptional activator SoxR [Thalassotalea euphylliae]